jgi:hypothetical protein
MPRLLSIALCLLHTAPLAFGATYSAPAATAKPQQCRVVWRESPQTSAILSWSTSTPSRKHQIRYRAEGSSEWITHPSDRDGKHSGAAILYYHHARLTGLEPASRYDVVFRSDGQESAPLWFRTAPADDVPVQLIFGGDSRSGLEDRRRMNGLVARVVREQSQQGQAPVVALAHGGDYVLDGRSLPQWSRWLTDYELTTSQDGQLLPIIPARGNHDLGSIFNELFDFPRGDKNYYATDLTPQVRLVTLNTETTTAGDQQDWLAKQLETYTSKRRWIIAQYHKPAFPAVKTPSSALTSWVPLFEQHGVRLVCEADGHCIKRTAPILGDRIDPRGVVYIGEGGLGVEQRSPRQGLWYLDHASAKVSSGCHLHLLQFDQQAIHGTVLMMDGAVFDEFSIEPRGE